MFMMFSWRGRRECVGVGGGEGEGECEGGGEGEGEGEGEGVHCFWRRPQKTDKYKGIANQNVYTRQERYTTINLYSHLD